MSGKLVQALGLIARCSLILCVAPLMEPDWDYMFVKNAWNSTNEELLRIDVRPIRVERGVYALNGTVVVGTDVDDSFILAIQILFNPIGSGQWAITPFQVKPMHFYQFMNTIFKEYFSEDLSKCAGSPYVGDEEYKEVMKAATFYVNKCIVKTKTFPRHMRPGYYKLAIFVNGPPVEFYCEIVIKIFKKDW